MAAARIGYGAIEVKNIVVAANGKVISGIHDGLWIDGDHHLVGYLNTGSVSGGGECERYGTGCDFCC